MDYMIENQIKAKIVIRGKDGKDDTVPETGLKFADVKAWEAFRALPTVAALIKTGELRALAA